MRKTIIHGLVWLLAVASAAAAPQQKPADSGVEERVDVELVLLETLVLDGAGATVPGLAASDFQLAVDGKSTPIESVDVFCPAGAVADVAEIAPDERRDPAPDVPRKIVLLFDYYHLAKHDRVKVLDEVKNNVRAAMTASDEVMVAALAPRLRVEQRFTSKRVEVLGALDRMNHDATLFAANLDNATGAQYLEALATLMDVLEPYDGTKAVVMYSPVLSRGDVTIAEFEDLARRAASALTTVYPAQTAWMKAPDPRRGMSRPKGGAGGTRILSLLAVGTGGRTPPGNTNDLSISLARAQRDMSCRYTIGFKMDSDVAELSHDVELVMPKPGHQVLFPARIRLWSEDERRDSRLRAAFVNPDGFSNALVRAGLFPVRPGGKGWETLVTLHLPFPLDGQGTDLHVLAELGPTGARKVAEYRGTFPIDASRGDGERVPVTILGDAAELKPGATTLTIALSRPGRADVVTAQFEMELPEVPKTGTFVRGPILGRVLESGVLIRPDRNEEEEETQLDRLLDKGQSIEPLIVHDIGPNDRLVAYSEVCTADKNRRGRPAFVDLAIYRGNGGVAHEVERASVPLESVGKLSCGGKLLEIPAGTLRPGEYNVQVSVVDGGGTILTRETTPLLVHKE